MIDTLSSSSSSSMFDTCTDSCGYIAAIIALFAYGTYGVPIKETHKSVPNLNPLVFQSYKTFVMLCMAPTITVLSNTPIQFTPWGILSGLLWVFGGTGGVIAVRYAGMATAVGTWASIMIFVNFIWGILIFHEPVANIYDTIAAFVLLTIGLIGMSTYSAPDNKRSHASRVELIQEHDRSSSTPSLIMNYSSFSTNPMNNANDMEKQQLLMVNEKEDVLLLSSTSSSGCPTSILGYNNNSNSHHRLFESYRSEDSNDEYDDNNRNNDYYFDEVPKIIPSLYNPETHVQLVISGIGTDGMIVSKRTIGILAAIFNGFMSGSSLIPLHYAEHVGNFGGPHFIFSYAIGAAIANIGLWVIYFIVLLLEVHEQTTSLSSLSSSLFDKVNHGMVSLSWMDKIRQALANMPEWHFRQLWKPGFAAGFFLTTAMFGSIISVTYLGQGIGNSIIQAKIIVSGIWGIIYYKEITNPHSIRYWFVSATISIAGIVWLSRERILAKQHELH